MVERDSREKQILVKKWWQKRMADGWSEPYPPRIFYNTDVRDKALDPEFAAELEAWLILQELQRG